MSRPPLKNLMSDHFGVRHEAENELIASGTPLDTDELVVLLGNKNGDVRRSAAMVLTAIGHNGAVDALCTIAVGDPVAAVREAATLALARFRDQRAFAPLLEVARQETAVGARINALLGLRRMRDPRAIMPLIGLLNDADASVRVAAADTLDGLARRSAGGVGAAQTDAAVSLLLQALRQPEPGVQEAAAAVLGLIGDPRALEPLVALLACRDIRLRKKVRSALARIDPNWTASAVAQAAVPALLAHVQEVKGFDLLREDASETLRTIGAAVADDCRIREQPNDRPREGSPENGRTGQPPDSLKAVIHDPRASAGAGRSAAIQLAALSHSPGEFWLQLMADANARPDLAPYAVQELGELAYPPAVRSLVRYCAANRSCAEKGKPALDSILKYAAADLSDADLAAACSLKCVEWYRPGIYDPTPSHTIKVGFDFSTVHRRAYAELLDRWTAQPYWRLGFWKRVQATEPKRPAHVGYELWIG